MPTHFHRFSQSNLNVRGIAKRLWERDPIHIVLLLLLKNSCSFSWASDIFSRPKNVTVHSFSHLSSLKTSDVEAPNFWTASASASIFKIFFTSASASASIQFIICTFQSLHSCFHCVHYSILFNISFHSFFHCSPLMSLSISFLFLSNHWYISFRRFISRITTFVSLLHPLS